MRFTDFLQGVGRPIAYYNLKGLTGSVTASILLCQLFYWNEKGSREDGFIYKSREDIENETGLSVKEQATARAALVSRGLIEERYARLEHKLLFKCNLDAINDAWDGFSPSAKREYGEDTKGNMATEQKVISASAKKELRIRTENTPEITSKSTTDINTNTVNDTDFDNFWNAYPRKVAKGDARKAWKALKPSEELAFQIIESVKQQALLEDWQKDNGKFIPYPATWLRAERWNDEIVDEPKDDEDEQGGFALSEEEIREIIWGHLTPAQMAIAQEADRKEQVNRDRRIAEFRAAKLAQEQGVDK